MENRPDLYAVEALNGRTSETKEDWREGEAAEGLAGLEGHEDPPEAPRQGLDLVGQKVGEEHQQVTPWKEETKRASRRCVTLVGEEAAPGVDLHFGGESFGCACLGLRV